jgi:hypothetical protein
VIEVIEIGDRWLDGLIAGTLSQAISDFCNNIGTKLQYQRAPPMSVDWGEADLM